MTPEQFVEKAIEGGYTKYEECPMCTNYNILLDPLAWKAVGKVMGWGRVSMKEGRYDPLTEIQKYSVDGMEAIQYMHAMIDALAEGKSIEQFLSTIKEAC